jgi:xanthine dehydrogenase YagS FAD-binding subunit
MQPFTYSLPVSENEALKAFAGSDHSKYIAGGTTLLDLMKYDIERPSNIVDINSLLYKGYHLKDNILEIGALEHMSDATEQADIKKNIPAISKSLLLAASPQIRNMATLGGNLMQRTRCTYFRDVACPCNKREPGSGCSAYHGFNRGHAILGGSEHCIAVHPSDFAVALAAFDGIIHLKSAKGERQVRATDFHLLPGNTPDQETVLLPGELITKISVPLTASSQNSTYLKLRDRASYAFAITSVAVGLEVKNGIIQHVNLALGGVGTKPWRSLKAEQAIIGSRTGKDTFVHLANLALEGAVPLSHNEFKIQLAKNAIVKTLIQLATI